MKQFSLYTEITSLLIIIIIPVAYIISNYLYKKDTTLTETPRFLKTILKFLRFCTITIILLLLLGIFTKHTTTHYVKPKLIVAYDNSESIKLTKNFNKQNNFLNDFSNKLNNLSSKYDIIKLKFGSNITNYDTLTYTEKTTNISNIYNFISQNYNKTDIASVLLISDFIYNTGENPLYNQNLINTTPVLLGDTTLFPDISIDKVFHSKIVYTGTIFKIQAKIKAQKLKNKTSEIKLINNNNNVIDKQIIQITGNNYYRSINFFVEAKKPGIEKYLLQIDTLKEENNKKNNSISITLEIKSERQIVYIITNITSPDVGCLITSLENTYQYIVKTSDFNIPIDSLIRANCVVIFLSETRNLNILKMLETLNKYEIPLFLIYGKNSNPSQLNKFFEVDLFKEKLNKYDEAYCEVNRSNNILNLTDEDIEIINSYPPLSVIYGEYNTAAESEIIFFQKIKQIVTSKPLLLLTKVNKQKIMILYGEGLYRWRLAEYKIKQQHTTFNRIINKIIAYLSHQKKKKQFLVKTESIYSSHQPINIEAELYTKNNEPINTPEVLFELKDSANNIYTFTFQKTSLFYNLTINSLPAGKYKWKATAKLDTNIYTESGEFYVKEESLETIETTANKDLAERIAKKTGSKVFFVDNIDSLIIYLKKLNFPGKIEVHTEYKHIIDFKILFFILILLFATEWSIRRYFGTL
ncbi:MAG: hypothetical protein N3A01_00035 [Bacteroidales bacterium]|nr:hypothetical protein [Bacteroidales bacterium]